MYRGLNVRYYILSNRLCHILDKEIAFIFSVYLRSSPEVCLQRIRKRDRLGEHTLSLVSSN